MPESLKCCLPFLPCLSQATMISAFVPAESSQDQVVPRPAVLSFDTEDPKEVEIEERKQVSSDLKCDQGQIDNPSVLERSDKEEETKGDKLNEKHAETHNFEAPDSELWIESEKEEIAGIAKMGTCNLVEMPPCAQVFGCRFVYE